MSAPTNKRSDARALVWDVAGVREACNVMPEVAWNRMTLDLLDVVEAAADLIYAPPEASATDPEREERLLATLARFDFTSPTSAPARTGTDRNA